MANTHKISRLKLKHETINTELNRVFSFRLAAGGGIVAILVTLSLGFKSPWMIVALLILGLGFLRLLAISRKIRRFQKRIEVLGAFYERQSRRQEGHPPTTPQPRVTSDELATDLDFFGPHSLLSQIDETVTDDGRTQLAQSMMKPKLNQDLIVGKQREVSLLSERAGFLRRLVVVANADLISRPTPFSLELLRTPLVDEGFGRRHLILWILFAAYVVIGAISFFTGISLPVGAAWFVFFMTSMFFLNKSTEAFNRVQALGLDGERLLPLFQHLERMDPALMSTFLPELKRSPLSIDLKQIDRLTSYLSVQTHPLVAVLVNGIVPWSYLFAARAERLRKKLEHHWPPLMDELHGFEVTASLSLLYRYQTKTFPTFVPLEKFSVRGIRHPLISTKNSVTNDFDLPQGSRLILITGSNMSGKSTFLRTLGLNQTLALMGGPVFAKEMKTPLARPITCIRVSDSVRDGVSYFYAETLRLKKLLDLSNESTIYLIDEMFRGTNNRERLIGSQSVVAALVQKKGLGLVTTHDLELTQLEKSHPELTNWHFSDDLDPSGLKFSYRINKGPCPSTNALRIMKSLGLPVQTPPS